MVDPELAWRISIASAPSNSASAQKPTTPYCSACASSRGRSHSAFTVAALVAYEVHNL
ncbi:hypothetical protein GGTG_13474 [Gaeumannomyces tritici R3-111a-1]|uniref:Uncharacterized protein n=1 Tax=Gaeumannomyces tritici (strain R3-111a-1) TaxID=644352 RepID=J3PIZ3_GAET3|nr:hypothetical protein GGTG_13474 [Gaeumannomyces tritici R3-111a-1]EJT68968.1 hypothetical protein GGTG_13474 [Gaeumannomyces tritici R3-111a-1]